MSPVIVEGIPEPWGRGPPTIPMRLQDGLQNLFASIEGTGEQEAAGLMAALVDYGRPFPALVAWLLGAVQAEDKPCALQ